MSKLFMVNLDIGHYARGGNDPFAYIKEQPQPDHTPAHPRHERMAAPQTSATATCRSPTSFEAIRDNKWPIACILEQGRTGFESTVSATKANLDVMRKALES